MDLQQRKELFRRMVEGNSGATRALDGYLRARGAQAAAGDAVARNELDQLVYEITYDYVATRLRRQYRFLLDRHSVASVVHQAWLRLLGPVPQTPQDLVGLCHRIGHMVHFAFLDIVQAHRQWDRRHHAPGPHADQVRNAPVVPLDQIEDGGSLDPAYLAAWSEFHERAAQLPDGPREVFRLRYYLGLPRGAIAGQLGVTEHQVRVRWLEALQYLGDIPPTAP